ncbi:MAG: hypothetical protein HFG54_08070 [Lachnospiraceae bacterium]|jgi:hypothetical protein|nr:hypothetical protein [Lachnospiraceae bacterium]
MVLETRKAERIQGSPQRRWKRPEERAADMLILIQDIRQGEPYGCMIYSHMERLSPFRSVRELLLQIDAVGRRMKVPGVKSFLMCGSTLDENEKALGAGDRILASERSIEGSLAEVLGWLKPKEYFHITLIGMEHGSLQGCIRGMRTGRNPVHFRSALELMYILSSICPP